MTLSTFVGADKGAKDPEPIVTKEVKEPIPNIQVVETQTGIPQTIQSVENPPVLEGKDVTMEEAPEMTVSNPSSRLLAFLARFDSLEFNSLPASHFYRLGPPFGNFLRFFVPIKGLPLLEGLFKSHGDFTSGFRKAYSWATS